MTINRLAVLLGTVITAISCGATSVAAADRPNVLMICIDDMNDWVNCLKSYRGVVHTPNIDRLAARGRLFTNAHTAFPMCGPSRNAILLGMNPWRTGMYLNGNPWQPNVPDAVPLPAHFKANGYHVAGSGKIFHQGPAYNTLELWDEYDRFMTNRPLLLPTGPINGIDRTKFKLYASMDWGPVEEPSDYMPDHSTVQWTVEYLQRKHEKPFFVTAGLFIPHIPWYAPKKFFDLYPLDDVKLPEVPADDLDDLPPAARSIKGKGFPPDLASIHAAGQRRQAVQAYLASISYADDLVGRLLNALDASPYRENTIVVLWSDHGWHLGEKNWWHKFTLWERSTRVPFIVAGPGVAQPGVATGRTVSLVDIYRTLIEVCKLPPRTELDGVSFAPLLSDPMAERVEPAITTFRPGDYAVRDERWRLIRYADGSEELYDHASDPNEWTNLASDPALAGVKKDLSRWIPTQTAPAAKVEARTHVYDGATRQWKPKPPATQPTSTTATTRKSA